MTQLIKLSNRRIIDIHAISDAKVITESPFQLSVKFNGHSPMTSINLTEDDSAKRLWTILQELSLSIDEFAHEFGLTLDDESVDPFD